VASFTTREIVAAKRTLAVVTSHTTLTSAARMVIQRLGRGDLSLLRLAGTNIVTFVARDFLVLSVTEANAKRRRHHRRARIATKLMTRPARRNVAAVRLRARRVTTKARRVGIEVGRNRHGDAAARGPVTSRATHAAHRNVARVIELHSETH